MRSTPRRAVLGAATAAVLTAAAMTAATPANAVSPDIVISQLYGGGGSGTAIFLNDYIELYNRGDQPVDVNGWSVQYASAAGSSWQVTPLTGSIAPGDSFLVAEGGGSAGEPLPTPNATGGIAMSNSQGKVALRTSTTALTGSTGIGALDGVRDFVGYGAASDSEGGSPAPGLNATTAAHRLGGGATDTDNNAADFAAAPPTPLGTEPGDGGEPGIPGLRIHDIQAAGHLSPYVGQKAEAVPGIVTAKGTQSFWIQDPEPDADQATSEGLEIFVGAAPQVAVGDSVTVTGMVTEFQSSGRPNDLRTTELTSPKTTVVASGAPVLAPAVVGPGGLIPPAEVLDDDATGNIETSGSFEPATDGIDFWESLEGMLLQIDDALVVGPSNNFGETPVVPVGSSLLTPRGGIQVRASDFNPERVVFDTLTGTLPPANVGDVYSGQNIGVLDYEFSHYEVKLGTSPSITPTGNVPEVTEAPTKNELAIATFNVENLAPASGQEKFDALAQMIVTNLAAPDILALEEVQDNDGPTNSGNVAADQTLVQLVAAISAAGGPAYQWRQIDPVDGADGGQPGGNIRVAFLFRTDRGLSFVDKAGGDSTTAVGVTGHGPKNTHLTASPGRVDPANPAWEATRKPLVGEFMWKGKTVFVIANHFSSKGGDQALYGASQPPLRPSETARVQQAASVRAFVEKLYEANPVANVVVLGDLNDFEFSDTLTTLTAQHKLTDLITTLPADERYTYVFEGNSQALDHILISPFLQLPHIEFVPGQFPKLVPGYEYDVVHANSEFVDQISDHDPQIVRLVPVV